MAAPKGNKYALGGPGGGRKSAYQEFQQAKRLWAIWTQPETLEEMQRLHAEGKDTLEIIHALRGAEGSERVLNEMFRKLYPETVKHQGDIENPVRFIQVVEDNGNQNNNNQAAQETV